MSKDKELLPIKVVFHDKSDIMEPHAGGGPAKIFGEFGDDDRDYLVGQMDEVFNYFKKVWDKKNLYPAVAKVTLKKDALAKSHRPDKLFSIKTCPIIGSMDFGELLIHIEPDGLEQLKNFSQKTDRETTANLSTIESILPYTKEDALREEDLSLFKTLIKGDSSIKVRLFNHQDGHHNRKLIREFRKKVAQLCKDAEIQEMEYLNDLKLFRVDHFSLKALRSLSSFVGVQSISPLVSFGILPQSNNPIDDSGISFPAPNPDVDYPIVGVIDTGTDSKNTRLQEWVVGRDEEDVPPEDQNNYHGSFVSSLICNSRAINQDDRFPAAQSKIFDLVALPEGSGVTEDDLHIAIERGIKNHPEIKVWNLSANIVTPVISRQAFSDFGMALDKLQRKYGVIISISIGNYKDLRSNFPEEGLNDHLLPPRRLTLRYLSRIRSSQA